MPDGTYSWVQKLYSEIFPHLIPHTSDAEPTDGYVLTYNATTDKVYWSAGGGGGGGTMSSITIAGDSGSNQTINDADTITIAGGTGLSSVASATDTITLNINLTSDEFSQLENIDTTTISATQWGYLGALDQSLATTDDVEFQEVTGTEFIGDFRGAVIFKAKAGEALTKGDVVYISSFDTIGNTPIVAKADADDINKMPSFGLAQSTVSLNASVDVVTFGTLSGLDTSSFSLGDILYVSTTAGGLTVTAPSGESSYIQNIAKVTRSHASSGSVKVGGAGRFNAVSNLNDGNIFIGNASNQATTSTLDTSIVPENTNLYYTDARARSAISVTDSGGAGSLSYDSSTGVITYTGSTDVTLATVANNYLSISGQEITAGTVPITLGGTGSTTASAARTALGVDAAGTDNSTDVTLNANLTDVFSISTQDISAVDFNANGTVVWDNTSNTLKYLGTSAFRSHIGLSTTSSVTFAGLTLNGNLDMNANSIVDIEQLDGTDGSGWLDFNMDTDSVYPQSTTDNQTVLGSVTHMNFVGDSNANGTGGEFYWGYGVNSSDSGTFTQTMSLDRSGNLEVSGDVQIDGDLTVSGTTTTINTETIALADNTIVLNSNATGSATEDAGIEVERGSDANKTLIWDETNDRWTIGSETFVAGALTATTIGGITEANLLDKSATETISGVYTHSANMIIQDSVNINFGTNSDAYLYHDDTNFNITNTKGDLIIKNDDSGGTHVEYIRLDASADKTVFVKDTKHNDNVYAYFGSSLSSNIRWDAANSRLDIRSDGDIQFIIDENNNSTNVFKIINGGSTNIFNLDESGNLTLSGNLTSYDDADSIITFGASTTNTYDKGIAFIEGSGTFGTTGNYGLKIYYEPSANIGYFQMAQDTTVNTFMQVARSTGVITFPLATTFSSDLDINADVDITGNVDIDGKFVSDKGTATTGTFAEFKVDTDRVMSISYPVDDGAFEFDNNNYYIFKTDGAERLKIADAYVSVDGQIRLIQDGSTSDNYISVGAGDDLKFYHNSSSYIYNATGNMVFYQNPTQPIEMFLRTQFRIKDLDDSNALLFDFDTGTRTLTIGNDDDGNSSYDLVSTEFNGNVDIQVPVSANLELTSLAGTGSPAQTTYIKMRSEHSGVRGQGIFYEDVGATNEQWYSGLPYAGSFNIWQVGFDRDTTSGDSSNYQSNGILKVIDDGTNRYVRTQGNYHEIRNEDDGASRTVTLAMYANQLADDSNNYNTRMNFGINTGSTYAYGFLQAPIDSNTGTTETIRFFNSRTEFQVNTLHLDDQYANFGSSSDSKIRWANSTNTLEIRSNGDITFTLDDNNDSANGFRINNGGDTTVFTVNESGDLALGSQGLEGWDSSYSAIEIGSTAIMGKDSATTDKDMYIMTNAYFDGAWKYKTTEDASLLKILNRAFTFQSAASGTADAGITWSTMATIDTSGLDVVGDITATSFGGITEANLLDKSSAETITGAYRFDGQVHIDTATNTVPLIISRLGSTTNENLKIGVDDRGAYFTHKQDETTGDHFFEFNIESSTSGTMYYSFQTAGTERVRISNNGLHLVSGATVSSILDEDDMTSDSATALATQQSIKAYVDSQVATANELSELTDVTLTSSASGDLLLYNGSAWVNTTTLTGAYTFSDVLSISGTSKGTNYLKILGHNTTTDTFGYLQGEYSGDKIFLMNNLYHNGTTWEKNDYTKGGMLFEQNIESTDFNSQFRFFINNGTSANVGSDFHEIVRIDGNGLSLLRANSNNTISISATNNYQAKLDLVSGSTKYTLFMDADNDSGSLQFRAGGNDTNTIKMKQSGSLEIRNNTQDANQTVNLTLKANQYADSTTNYETSMVLESVTSATDVYGSLSAPQDSSTSSTEMIRFYDSHTEFNDEIRIATNLGDTDWLKIYKQATTGGIAIGGTSDDFVLQLGGDTYITLDNSEDDIIFSKPLVTTATTPNATEGTAREAIANYPIAIEEEYTANEYVPLIGAYASNNSATQTKVGIYYQQTGSGTNLFLGTSNAYSTGVNKTVKVDYSGGLTATDSITAGTTLSTGSFTIPNSIGSAGQVLQVPSSGTTLQWATVSSGGGSVAMNESYTDIGVSGLTAQSSLTVTTAPTDARVYVDGIKMRPNTNSTSWDYDFYRPSTTTIQFTADLPSGSVVAMEWIA